MIVYCVNAFTKDGSGGNGAGVVLLESPLSDGVKTQIAKTMGYSETAFVSTSTVADFKLEYFTPEGEVPLCGHATIGTFVVLNSLKKIKKPINTIQTKAGVLEVTVDGDGTVFMEQTLPEYGVVLEKTMVESCFQPLELAKAYPVQLVSTGLMDILMPVDGAAALATMTPDFPAITALSKAENCVGIHGFALVNQPELTAICRNFAPLYGIDEEAATGTSNCALACYLFRYGLVQNDYVFEQGYNLGSVSRICVRLDYTGETITKVSVGGSGKLLEKVTINI